MKIIIKAGKIMLLITASITSISGLLALKLYTIAKKEIGNDFGTDVKDLSDYTLFNYTFEL